MTDKPADHETASPLLTLASSLPAPVAQGALKAIGRLIGGMADYPAAWLRRASQGVEDGTNARAMMANAIAAGAAAQAAADPIILERAIQSYTAKAVRKQINAEGVAGQALLALASPPKPDEPESPPAPDDDWMNIFERYAEDASSEKMQLLWGRVLAGEIRKPASFSLGTMRFLAEADQETVQLAKRISEIMVADFIFKTDEMERGALFTELLNAQEIGLLSGVGGLGISWTPKLSKDGWLSVRGQSHSMRVDGIPGTEIKFDVIAVTRIGREVARLSPATSEMQILEGVADKLKGQLGVDKIMVGRNMSAGTMESRIYWTKDQESAVDTP